MTKNKKNNKGFSLVEIIIVVAVIVVIASLIVPEIIKYVESARQANDLQRATHILRGMSTSILDPKNNVPAGFIIEVIWVTGDNKMGAEHSGRLYVRSPYVSHRFSVHSEQGIPGLPKGTEDITDALTVDVLETIGESPIVDPEIGTYGYIGDAESKLCNEASLAFHIDTSTGDIALAQHIDTDYDGDVNIWFDRLGLDAIRAPE